MSPLEQLFAYEIEFFRRLRISAPAGTHIASPHTSYALQHNYESLIHAIRSATDEELSAVEKKSRANCDARDICSACASLRKMLDLKG